MILLDTNVIIDLLNNEDDSRWDLLNQEDCVICGIVISELYSGIKSNKEEKSLMQNHRAFLLYFTTAEISVIMGST